MSKLDERKIINVFQKKILKGGFASEDVETFKLGRDYGVLKIDTLVASTDVPPGMSPSEIARKSIVSAVSDFAAKGVRPLYCTISVSLPRWYNREKIMQMAKGFGMASEEFGFKILGGDTNESKDLSVSAVLFGLAKKIPRRSGARIGDYIIATGSFGASAAGIKILVHKKNAKPQFRKVAVGKVLRPDPRLEFGIASAPFFSSSMDSSDGLSTTLNEMAQRSGKRFVIDKVPKGQGVEEFARANKLDVMDLVFNGGEEFEIVATISPKNFQKIKAIARREKTDLVLIGTVQRGKGVFLSESGKNSQIPDLGWTHFA